MLFTYRTSSSQTPENTPYELWYGIKPQIGHLKVFGSVGYVHVADQMRTKLEEKSKKMILVGYDNNNYRMYDPNTKTIKISRNVIFDEHLFPEIRKNIAQINIMNDEDNAMQNNKTETGNAVNVLDETSQAMESDDSI